MPFLHKLYVYAEIHYFHGLKMTNDFYRELKSICVFFAFSLQKFVTFLLL